MQLLVVDAHALVWCITEPHRLGKKARRLLGLAEHGRATAHVPAICLVEISLLHERGRLRFGADRVVAELARHPGWQVLAMDMEQCMAFTTLAAVKDPMDRLVAASARALGCVLVSADAMFDRAGLQRAWD